MRTDNRQMALMYYHTHCEKILAKMPDKQLKELADEISDLSGNIPIFEPKESYKPNSFLELTKDKRYIKADKENNITIKNINGKYTPLFLNAILVYAVNRLSGNQLEDKEGFDYIKLSKKLAEAK